MNSFYICVLGCQQNVHDSVKLQHMLSGLGLIETDDKSADLIIVTACAVRQTGVDRIHGKLRHWKDKKVLITGCMLDEDKRKFAKMGVDFFDIEKPEELGKILKIKNQKQIKDLAEEGKKYSSSVPIMFGCDNFCSYCATPYTRGRERSRDFTQIVSEVQKLIDSNHEEILLLGQNVNSYRDPKTLQNFEDLLRSLDLLEGNFKIAFTSNHPKDMTDGIIDAVSDLQKIKKEIHLPVQSGSDKILKAMNRPYTIAQYLEIVKKIKSVENKIDLTTDVIVGFPGETDEDFEQTAKIFRDVKYTMAYINKYSPRVGTAAFKLGDPIPWSEKQRRWRILDEILKTSSPKFHQ